MRRGGGGKEGEKEGGAGVTWKCGQTTKEKNDKKKCRESLLETKSSFPINSLSLSLRRVCVCVSLSHTLSLDCQ
jgi:hypothetical protein